MDVDWPAATDHVKLRSAWAGKLESGLSSVYDDHMGESDLMKIDLPTFVPIQSSGSYMETFSLMVLSTIKRINYDIINQW